MFLIYYYYLNMVCILFPLHDWVPLSVDFLHTHTRTNKQTKKIIITTLYLQPEMCQLLSLYVILP